MIIEIDTSKLLVFLSLTCIFAGIAGVVYLNEVGDSCNSWQSSYNYMECLEKTDGILYFCFLLFLGGAALFIFASNDPTLGADDNE